jgi:RNA polymerase sigma-70 factor (ECF subfamily)
MPSVFRPTASRATDPRSGPSIPTVHATDDAAFATLFRAHYADLCSFVYCYVRSRAVAEELVQEVFLDAWERRGLVTRSFLFTGARNSAISHLRRERTHARWAARVKDEETEHSIVSSPAEHDLEYEALCARVDAEIARLPERCRLVFTMHRQQHLSYAEIAGLLGVSIKAVEAQMGRALRALRRTVLPLLLTSATFFLVKL